MSDGTAAHCVECRQAEAPLQRTVAALSYGFPWEGAITRFKFHQGLDLAGMFATRLTAAVHDAGPVEVDLVLPIPLSPARLRERGYNQAWELARRTARRLGRPVRSDVLLRSRDTARQSDLDRALRTRNVQGAFVVAPWLVHRIAGRRVALVDDVMTSGATLHEAADTLQRAGAASVQAWVLARTPRR